MCDYITWDADEVSQGVRILEGASESLAANTVEIPSGFGQNQDNLTEKIIRINAVIETLSYCSFAIGKGLTGASEAFAGTDAEVLEDMKAVDKYREGKGF